MRAVSRLALAFALFAVALPASSATKNATIRLTGPINPPDGTTFQVEVRIDLPSSATRAKVTIPLPANVVYQSWSAVNSDFPTEVTPTSSGASVVIERSAAAGVSGTNRYLGVMTLLRVTSDAFPIVPSLSLSEVVAQSDSTNILARVESYSFTTGGVGAPSGSSSATPTAAPTSPGTLVQTGPLDQLRFALAFTLAGIAALSLRKAMLR